MRVTVCLALLLVGGCSATPTDGRTAVAGVPDQPRASVRVAVPPGSVVRVLPATLSGTGDVDRIFLSGLMREALRQSTALDFAGGVEDMPAAELAVAIHCDQDAASFTTTLQRKGQPPIPLATASGTIPEAIDRLALATRQTLDDASASGAATCAMIYSAEPEPVVRVEEAAARSSVGRLRSAEQLLREARPRDPGCTLTLAALAALLLDQGRQQEAARIAREALGLEGRLSETTRHRLARTLLLARASSSQPEAVDRELLQLADTTLRERPHEPHARYSRALALNFLSRFEESAPLLRSLRSRWPNNAVVAYHLTFAELANGRPQAARKAIESVRDRLPKYSIVLPGALALYHCGAHEELRKHLQNLADDPLVVKSALLHEVRRMQAAHALLTDRPRDAVRFLLADLEWIRQRPSKLERLALHVAETGEVMVRIGHHEDLRIPLAAFEDLDSTPAVFDEVLVFLSGLIQVVARRERAEPAEANLERSGQQAWSSTLRATAHRLRGELQDEMRQWVLAYQSSESPLIRASLARVLRAAGSDDTAARVTDELRQSLLSFSLRPPYRHPMVSPAAALAYLATL